MDIKFYGHACFSISEGTSTVIMDPFSKDYALKFPDLSADVVTISHNHPFHNAASVVSGNPMVFDRPGEYETKGVHFRLIHSFHNPKDDEEQLENNITLINWEGIRFCHLGAQGTKLTPEQLELVGDVDILFVPVGGSSHSLDAKKAKEVIEQIEPRIVIPMCYAVEGDESGMDSRDAFLSVMGVNAEESVNSFKVKRSELPEDNSKTILLNVAI